MALVEYLLETSVLTRLEAPTVRARVEGLVGAGTVALSGITMAEVLRGARSPAHHRQTRERLHAFHRLPAPDEIWDRILEVQSVLAEKGLHQSVKMPDLAIAAIAERNGVTVLHYDQDFDVIAEVTGQRCEWVVPRGTA